MVDIVIAGSTLDDSGQLFGLPLDETARMALLLCRTWFVLIWSGVRRYAAVTFFLAGKALPHGNSGGKHGGNLLLAQNGTIWVIAW